MAGTSVSANVLHDIDPRTDRRWAGLHRQGGSLFSSSTWLAAVADTYGLVPRARIALGASGAPLAGIAYCEIDDPMGRRVVSFPFSDFQEPLGDLEAAATVIESLVGDRPIRFRMPADRLPDLSTKVLPDRQRNLLHHTISIDASGDSEKLFAGLKGQVRQNIRRAGRQGVEVEMRHDLEAVREFYELHVGVRTRKYRLLPQPYAFFSALHEAFGGDDRIVVALARLDGRAIAGILYIESGSTLYYKFNASATDGLSVRPNEQLIWAGMEHCLKRDLTAIDLGVSDTDQPGLVRYKRKFADVEQEVVTIGSPGDPRVAVHAAGATELRAVFGQLTAVLTDERVPPSVAEEAGAILYRYFV